MTTLTIVNIGTIILSLMAITYSTFLWKISNENYKKAQKTIEEILNEN